MAKLSKKEKEELLEMANSARLRKDFRIMALNNKKMTIPEYLEFLTSASEILPDPIRPEHKEYKKLKI